MRKYAEYQSAPEEKIPSIAKIPARPSHNGKWKVHSGTRQEEGRVIMMVDQIRTSLLQQCAPRQACKTALIRWRSQ